MLLPLSSCTIRPWAESDAVSLQRHANNRNVSLQLRDRFPFPYEMEHAAGFLKMIASQDAPTAWAIEIDGEAAGGIGLERKGDIERVSAEIGYWLAEQHWGKGIATEAVRAVTGAAFARFELTRIYALTFAEHAASMRVLEKAGFVREGHMRRSAIKNGVIRDQILYATYKP